MAFINSSLTDKASFSVAVETSPGTLPVTPEWTYLEVNSVGDMGETINTVSRDPISNDRMRRKGGIVGLDSNVGFDADLTYSLFDLFAQGFFFSSWEAQASFVPSAVTTSAFTVAADGDLADGTLVYARGFSNSSNNGLFVTDTATETAVEVTDTLVADASPDASKVRLDVVGVQGATGDITMTAAGSLESTTLDFTSLGIVEGQWIYVGGGTTATSFPLSGDGYARVQSVAEHVLTLEKVPDSFGADTAATETIQLFIGSFIRNVAQSSDDFITETYSFEVIYDTLTNKYHYPNGNYADSLSLSMNMQDKATVSYSFVGLDTPVPTSVKSAGNWSSPIDTTMLNTSSDIGRLEILTSSGDEIVPSDECLLQDLTITISNNIEPKKGLGCLETVMVTLGNFNVDISGTMYLTTDQPIVSVRDNDTMGLAVALSNEDGGILLDIPSMTLGDGSRDFPTNDTINVNLSGMAFKDETYDFALGATKFPHLPI